MKVSELSVDEIIIIIGMYIAPIPFIKCSKALHIVIVHKASVGKPEKVCFETLFESRHDVESFKSCGSAFHNRDAILEKVQYPNTIQQICWFIISHCISFRKSFIH